MRKPRFSPDGYLKAEVYMGCRSPQGFPGLKQFKEGKSRAEIMEEGGDDNFIQTWKVKPEEASAYRTSFRCRKVQHGSIQCPFSNNCPYAEVLVHEVSEFLDPEHREFIYDDAIEELNNLIGLLDVKEEVRRWTSYLKVIKERKRRGLIVKDVSLHMLFSGNPGTGKTTVARILSDILFGLGFTNKRKVTEVERADLVAGYVGQTAMKTKKVIEAATGGVLFIDEAYSLARGEYYGREAIDVLVKNMEDRRGDPLVVIFAGYKGDMETFLSTNKGLRSRIAKFIEFKDYLMNQLLKIATYEADRRGYVLTEDSYHELEHMLGELKQDNPNFGNAREVRTLLEHAIHNQAARVAEEMESLSDEDFSLITCADF